MWWVMSGDNVGVFFVDGQGVYSWYIGQVLAMCKVLDTGRKVDYFLPVSLQPADESVKLMLKYFKQVDETNPREFQYGGFEGEESDAVALTSVICRIVSLKYDLEKKLFVICQDELDSLTSFVDTNNEKRQTNKRKRAARQEEQRERADEGRLGTMQARSKSGRRVTKLGGLGLLNS